MIRHISWIFNDDLLRPHTNTQTKMYFFKKKMLKYLLLVYEYKI